MKNLKLFIYSLSIVIFYFSSASIAFGQVPAILVDGNEVLVSSEAKFPVWLDAGKTLAPNKYVVYISVIEYNITAHDGEDDKQLHFGQVKTVSRQETVPSGKTWKVEGVFLSPSLSSNPRLETVTALKAIGQDLKIDTTNYNKILNSLREVSPVLLEAMNGQVAYDDLDKIKAILLALRAYHGIGVQKYGYRYLSHNIRNPKIHVPGLLHWIGLYHELSGPEGNFGGFNKDYYDITFENHKKLFETFPNYLHPDTIVANQAIRDGVKEFFNSRYWLGRIGLTYRQITSYNIPVYMHNKQLSVKIIKMIDKEIQF